MSSPVIIRNRSLWYDTRGHLDEILDKLTALVNDDEAHDKLQGKQPTLALLSPEGRKTAMLGFCTQGRDRYPTGDPGRLDSWGFSLCSSYAR